MSTSSKAPDYVWGSHPAQSPMWDVAHSPRHYYDCTRCKFAWNCGTTSSCILMKDGSIPDPPKNIALRVRLAQQRWRIHRGIIPC
jgi:hypothetical protein